MVVDELSVKLTGLEVEMPEWVLFSSGVFSVPDGVVVSGCEVCAESLIAPVPDVPDCVVPSGEPVAVASLLKLRGVTVPGAVVMVLGFFELAGPVRITGSSVESSGSAEPVLGCDPPTVDTVVEGVADWFEPSEVLEFGSLSEPDLVLDGTSVNPFGSAWSVSDESVLDLSESGGRSVGPE